MKNTKTTIRELSARYRDILKKCFYLNAVALGLFAATSASAGTLYAHDTESTADPLIYDKAGVDDLVNAKQDTLTAEQLAAVDSGITAAGVAQITTNKNDIATINSSDVMTSGITAAGVAQITTNKNDIATINSSDVMTSGITAAGVAQITTNKNDIATINSSDVMTSGITAAGVAQITTNKNDIAKLNGDEGAAGSVKTIAKGYADTAQANAVLDAIASAKLYPQDAVDPATEPALDEKTYKAPDGTTDVIWSDSTTYSASDYKTGTAATGVVTSSKDEWAYSDEVTKSDYTYTAKDASGNPIPDGLNLNDGLTAADVSDTVNCDAIYSKMGSVTVKGSAEAAPTIDPTKYQITMADNVTVYSLDATGTKLMHGEEELDTTDPVLNGYFTALSGAYTADQAAVNDKYTALSGIYAENKTNYEAANTAYETDKDAVATLAGLEADMEAKTTAYQTAKNAYDAYSQYQTYETSMAKAIDDRIGFVAGDVEDLGKTATGEDKEGTHLTAYVAPTDAETPATGTIAENFDALDTAIIAVESETGDLTTLGTEKETTHLTAYDAEAGTGTIVDNFEALDTAITASEATTGDMTTLGAGKTSTLLTAYNAETGEGTVVDNFEALDTAIGDMSQFEDKLGVTTITEAIYKEASVVGAADGEDSPYASLSENSHLTAYNAETGAGSVIENMVALDNATIAIEEATGDLTTLGVDKEGTNLVAYDADEGTGTIADNFDALDDAIIENTEAIAADAAATGDLTTLGAEKDTTHLTAYDAEAGTGTIVDNFEALDTALLADEAATGDLTTLGAGKDSTRLVAYDAEAGTGTIVDNFEALDSEDQRIADELIGEEDLAELSGEYLADEGSTVAGHFATMDEALTSTFGTKEAITGLGESEYFGAAAGGQATTASQDLATSLSNLNENLVATIGSPSDIAGLSGSYLSGENSSIADHLEAINGTLENTLGSADDLQTALKGEMFQKKTTAEAGGSDDDEPTLATALTNLNDNVLDAIAEQTQNLNDAQEANAAQFARVDRKLHKLETKMEKGLAANNALAGLVPLDHVHKTQISAALGGYSNNQALAVGAFHYLNSRTLLNAGAAYGGNDSVSYKVGVTFGF